MQDFRNVHVNRMDRAIIGVDNPQRYSKQEVIAYLNRVIKRMNKAAGYDTDKKPSTWSFKYENILGVVEAHTRSQARAEIKKMFGVKKLPTTLNLEKVNEPNQQSSNG